MKDHYDPWYVRLPDGRTIKAKSTASVRHHVEAGHIPLNSLVRRDSNEEWVGLVWVAEFSDLRKEPGPHHAPTPAAGPPARSGVAARLDPLRLQTVGVRGLIDELMAALDSALTRSKMAPAFVAALLLYVGMYAIRAGLNSLFEPPAWVPLVASVAFALVVLSVLNAVLAKLTHLELSTMRPARLRDGLGSLGGQLGSVLLANLVVAGGALVVLYVAQRVPGWVSGAMTDAGVTDRAQEIFLLPIWAVVLLVSVLVWLVVGLCWLLTPAIVVEESSWLAGVREWRQLLSDHFGRIVVYEGLTVLLGVGVSLPLTLAVRLALGESPGVVPVWPVGLGDGSVAGVVPVALHGLSAAPLLAVLAVANVFIYLNLRYEHGR